MACMCDELSTCAIATWAVPLSHSSFDIFIINLLCPLKLIT